MVVQSTTIRFMDYSPNSIPRRWLIEEFSVEKQENFRQWFYRKYSRHEVDILDEIYYKELKRDQKMTTFTVWFWKWYSKGDSINVLEDNTKTWAKIDGTSVQSVHPPPEPVIIKMEGKTLKSIPFQLGATTTPIKQQNYTNLSLQTIGSQLSRIEDKIQEYSGTLLEKQESTKKGQQITEVSIKPSPEIKNFNLADKQNEKIFNLAELKTRCGVCQSDY